MPKVCEGNTTPEGSSCNRNNNCRYPDCLNDKIMTTDEFNEKYKDYLEEGHYGLAISTPQVIEYLDSIFPGLTLVKGFKYSQIKDKFGMARVYMKPNIIDTYQIEAKIDKIFADTK